MRATSSHKHHNRALRSKLTIHATYTYRLQETSFMQKQKLPCYLLLKLALAGCNYRQSMLRMYSLMSPHQITDRK